MYVRSLSMIFDDKSFDRKNVMSQDSGGGCMQKLKQTLLHRGVKQTLEVTMWSLTHVRVGWLGSLEVQSQTA